MNKSAFILLSVIIFCCACKENNNNNKQLSALCKAIQNSNQTLENVNANIYRELKNKTYDLPTRAKAAIWQPKATMLQNVSLALRNYTDSLRDLITSNSRTAKNILEKQVESMLKKFLQAKLNMLDIVFDTTVCTDNLDMKYNMIKTGKEIVNRIPFLKEVNNDKKFPADLQSFKEDNFANAGTSSALASLYKIDNDILITENILLDYCNAQVGAIIEEYTVFSMIASISSSVVKAGQPIIIHAGIGAFSASRKPTVLINGRKIDLLDDAIAIDTVIAKGKPGKYSISIHIEYTGDDEKRVSKDERVQYIIKE